MQVLNSGDVILLRKITFEDGQYDIKEGHPGIVLIPTNENDEEAMCLYMTSSKNRKNDKRYLLCNNGVRKRSFLNIQKIVKTSNINMQPLNIIPNDELYHIIHKFYEYQTEHPDENFEKIKNKIEIMLQLFALNDKAKVLTECDMDINEISALEQVENVPMMHMAYLINKGMINLEKIPVDVLSYREKMFLGKLQTLYEQIRGEKIESFNLENNIEFKIIYENTKIENSLININTLFEKLIEMMRVLNTDKRKISIINSLIQSEKENQDNRENISQSKFKKKNKRKRNRNKRDEDRRKNYEDKYGKIDFDFFDL